MPGDLKARSDPVAELISLGLLRPGVYQMLHGGASADHAPLRGPLAAVQRRGRWVSHRSLRLYSMESWLLVILVLVHPVVLAFDESVFGNLEAAPWHRLLGPGLPRWPSRHRFCFCSDKGPNASESTCY